MANADFAVIRQTVEYWLARYAGIPGAEEAVLQVVHEAFELELLSKVVHAKAFKGTLTWAGNAYERLTSPEALTLASLGVVATDQVIAAKLGSRLGAAGKQAA